MSEELKLAMVRARIAFLRHPNSMFLSTVCFMLKLKYEESIGTGATNGVDLFIAPSFFLKLDPKMQVTLLAHETFHVALQHCIIGQQFTNKNKFNYAADYVINCFLVEAGFEPIKWLEADGTPNGWLYDPQYKGMTTKQVYDLLPDDPEQLASLAGSQFDVHMDPGAGSGEDGQGGGNSPADIAAVQRQIVNIINTAAAVASQGNQAGSIPKDIEVFLEKLKKPKLPLSQHLRKFFTQVAKNDYTWRKLNRRLFPHMLAPGLSGIKLTEIAFAYDMSGSVSDKDTTRYQSELVGVMRYLKPDSLRLIQFDWDIKRADKIKSIQDLANIRLVGRGGTNIEPVMEWAKKNKPTAMVVFTDGEYTPPSFNPGIPILWVIHGRSKDRFHCDFGTIIRFDT